MKHIAVVFGTRPEVVKLGPVIQELRRAPQVFRVTVVATGQHREMLRQALTFFDIVPDVGLDIMRPDQDLFTLTARALNELRDLFDSARPDLVMVQGDTTTAFAAALAGYYARIGVAHVEAGLRSGDLSNPYPEEGNRRMISSLADWHFAPTAVAEAHLRGEGVPADRVFVTGNTVIDTLAHVLERRASLLPDTVEGLELAALPPRVLLVTCHRRESFGEDLRRIFAGLRRIVEKNPDVAIVYPVHPNPNVEGAARALLHDVPRIHLLPPVDYEAFLALMRRAHLILTDSGGVQEEAPFLNTPVLVLRTVTERPEGVAAGVARLVGTDTDQIVAETQRLLDDAAAHSEMARSVNPYGDGRAAERIVAVLRDRWMGAA
jgi:UDP-N-acetylglucosamine 2-epimerase (non-hydrolysing)